MAGVLDESGGRKRSRSFSVGSAQQDLQSKYWALLFENLRRSVDEIYSICESGHHVVESKEVVTQLETYALDFKNLIKWLQAKEEFDKTPALKKRNRLPWECRKSALALKLSSRSKPSTPVDPPKISPSPDSNRAEEYVATATLGELTSDVQLVDLEEKKKEDTPSMISSDNSTASFDTTVTKIKVSVATATVAKGDKPIVTSKYSHVVNRNVPVVQSPVCVKKPLVVGVKPKVDTGIIVKGVKPLLKQTKTSLNSSTRLIHRAPVDKSVTPKPVITGKPVPAKPVSALKEQQRRFGVSVEDLPSNATGVYEEGSHGWEMVRGRPRLKNSPPKTLLKHRSTSQSYTDIPLATDPPKPSPTVLERAKTAIAPFLPSRAPRVSPRSADGSKVKTLVPRTAIEKAPSFRTEVPKRRPVQEVSKTLPRQKKPLIKISPKIVRKEMGSVEIKEKIKSDMKVDETRGIGEKKEEQNDVMEVKKDEVAEGAEALEKVFTPESQEGIEFKREILIPILICESVTPVNLSRETSSSELIASRVEINQTIPSTPINTDDKYDENLDRKSGIGTPISDMLLSEFIGIGQSETAHQFDFIGIGQSETAHQFDFIGIGQSETAHQFSTEKVELLDKKYKEELEDVQPMSNEMGKVNSHFLVTKGDSEAEVESGLATPRDDESLLDEKEMEENTALWEQTLIEEACLHQQMIDAEGTDTDTDPDDSSTVNSGSLTSSQPQLLFEGMSWSEEVEFEHDRDSSQLSRAFDIHEKLSSPSRRRAASPDEAFRLIEERHARASRLRKQLFQEKAVKRKELQNKIDEVRDAKDKLAEQKRHLLERKMLRAEEKRQRYLADIVRKAHDEETKLRELAFINELEAQNKRIDFITSCQSQEERLHGLHEERQRKQEEKAMKDAAVEERKKVLEAERHAKLVELQERRRRKEEKIDRENQEKMKHKEEIMREKQRDRQERISAIQAAHQATVEELQKKIQIKQEEYARRHEENIEHIKLRASELAVSRFSTTPEEAPLLTPYERKKFCNLCSALIGSEIQLLSHIRGRIHQEALKNGTLSEMGGDPLSLPYIVEAPDDVIALAEKIEKEQKKTYAKRLKKLRSRMMQRSGNNNAPLEKTLPENLKKSRMGKLLGNINRIASQQTIGQWESSAVTQIERSVDELLKILSQQRDLEQSYLQSLGGFEILSRTFIASLPDDNSGSLTKARCSESLLICLRRSLNDNFAVATQIIIDLPPLALVDQLVKRLELLLSSENTVSTSQLSVVTTLPNDSLTGGIFSLISTLLNTVSLYSPCAIDNRSEEQLASIDVSQVKHQTADFISYLLCSGVVDWISVLCSRCQSPLEGDIDTANLLTAAFRCLHAAVDCLYIPSPSGKKLKNSPQDVTGLIDALKESELVGIISTLYGILLHQGALSRGTQSPIRHSAEILAVVSSGIRLLICFARLDLKGFQAVLCTEGISLQFRHISSHLLRFCGRDGGPSPLLDNLIICIGYFAVGHTDNQTIIQSGQQPSVLQQLCQLPFVYFSDPSRRLVLFPTLLACSVGSAENKDILEQEMNYQMLEDFLLLSESSRSHLVSIVQVSSKK